MDTQKFLRVFQDVLARKLDNVPSSLTDTNNEQRIQVESKKRQLLSARTTTLYLSRSPFSYS